MKLQRLFKGSGMALWSLFCVAILSGFSPAAWAMTEGIERLNLTASSVGYVAVFVFVLAYIMVMAEESLHLRKSKPVLVAAGIIWGMIGFVYVQNGMSEVS